MRVDRINRMERYILENESVSLTDLAEHFDVSINTVRRDIGELLARGRVRKVYGGVAASLPSENLTGPQLLPFAKRAVMNSAEKQLIGSLAAPLVRDNSTVFLDSGSTVACMLPYLAQRQGLTIVTHSLQVIIEAAHYPSLNVLALGGMLNRETYSCISGPNGQLDQIHLQTLFMAASAISDRWGVGNNTYDEFVMKTELTRRCEDIVVLADHSKFDRPSRYSFCPLNRIRTLVTDQKPPRAYLDVIEENRIRLIYPQD